MLLAEDLLLLLTDDTSGRMAVPGARLTQAWAVRSWPNWP